MTTCRGFRAFLRSRRASAAIEFAIIIPIMLALLAGIVELGRGLQAYNVVNRLASRYAISYADCSDIPNGTCQTELATYVSTFAVQNMAPQLTSPVVLRMFEVQLLNGSMNVKYAWPSNTPLSGAEIVAAQKVLQAQQFGVVVTISYNFSPIFFTALVSSFMNGPYTVSYTIAQVKS